MSKTKFIVFSLIALLIPLYNSVAQKLGNIPGQEDLDGTTSLIDYLNGLYKFGISITAILALFMIALGAFGYIVTSIGNPSKVMDAKEKITNALIGLIIALTAYLFLYVINPDLVTGTLEAPAKIIGDITGEDENLYDGVECDYEGSCGSCLNCSDCPDDEFYKNGEDYFCGSQTQEPPGYPDENKLK
jgi:hypothetical protein